MVASSVAAAEMAGEPASAAPPDAPTEAGTYPRSAVRRSPIWNDLDRPIDLEGGFTGPVGSVPPAPEATGKEAENPALVAAPVERDVGQRGTDALALVGYEPEAVGYSVTFLPAKRGIQGRTLRIPQRIEIFVREHQNDRSIAFVIAHELGHAIDFEFGTPERRRRWVEARRIDPGLSWFGCETCEDRSTPAGDFAESFAAWRVGPEPDFDSGLGPPPNQEQVALLEELSRPARRNPSPPATQVEVEPPHVPPSTTTTTTALLPATPTIPGARKGW